MNYISAFDLGGFTVDVGSDWHFELDGFDPIESAKMISSGQKSSVLFCVGDLFETSKGDNCATQICALLNNLSDTYRAIVYMPGNHCLRGRKNPWSDFNEMTLSRNVYTAGAYDGKGKFKVGDPLMSARLSLRDLDPTLPEKNILISNIFYDMRFLDPAILGLSKKDIVNFYATTNDGSHFLGGNYYIFEKMSVLSRTRLNDSIDILVTHALPHPSLVTFRVPEKTEEVLEKEKSLGIPFICDPEHDEKEGAKWNSNGEGYRAWWNQKSFIMGSDLLTGQPFKDGLTCIYGHNHRSNNRSVIIDGKKVNFISHQPNPWQK